MLQSEAIPQKDNPLFGAALDQLSASGKTAIQPHVQTGGRKAAIALLTSFLRGSKSILYQESCLAITRAGYIDAIIAASGMGNNVIA
jgi:ABC-type uncharacterized transport system YnjBCD ATPase subunit